MDCKIIEDLITLYAEDLCSEDSKKMVEEHLKTCENCQKKLADYKKDLAEELYQDKKIEENKKEQNEQLPDDIHPFKKIKEIMWYRWICIVVLGVVLALVVSFTGLLGYAQLTKESGLSSFETISDGFAAKKLCQKFADGDMEGFVNGLHIAQPNYDARSFSLFLSDQQENLTNLYNEQLKDKDIKVHVEETGYTESKNGISSKATINSNIQIAMEIEEDYTLFLSLNKMESNLFALENIWYEPCEDENEEDKYFELSTILDCFTQDSISGKITTSYENCLTHIMKNIDYVLEKDMFPDMFFKEGDDLLTPNTKYTLELKERLKTLLKEKVTVTDCIFQTASYDEEKKALITKMYLTVEDTETKNAAVLICEFEKVDLGFKITEAETEVIGTLDENVMEQLGQLFD